MGDCGLLAEFAIPAGILLHRLQLDFGEVLAAKDHAGALQIDGLGRERHLVERLERGDRWQILLDVFFLVLAGAGLAQFLHEFLRIADREIGQEGRDDIRGLLLGFGICDQRRKLRDDAVGILSAGLLRDLHDLLHGDLLHAGAGFLIPGDVGHAPAVLLRVLSEQLGLALKFDLELVLTDPSHQLAGGGGGATIANIDARDIQLAAHE